MIYPEGFGPLYQATSGAILKYSDRLLYLPIGFAVANGDVVVDNAQPFSELCKAAHKLSTIICPDLV